MVATPFGLKLHEERLETIIVRDVEVLSSEFRVSEQFPDTTICDQSPRDQKLHR